MKDIACKPFQNKDLKSSVRTPNPSGHTTTGYTVCMNVYTTCKWYKNKDLCHLESIFFVRWWMVLWTWASSMSIHFWAWRGSITFFIPTKDTRMLKTLIGASILSHRVPKIKFYDVKWNDMIKDKRVDLKILCVIKTRMYSYKGVKIWYRVFRSIICSWREDKRVNSLHQLNCFASNNIQESYQDLY